MQAASVFFAVSLVGLTGMLVSKVLSIKNGRPGMFSFLSRFDAPLASLVLSLATYLRQLLASLWRNTTVFLERSHHLIASLLHFIVQMAERRMRAWSEFARTRKFERRDASEFIKDVTQYKKELKQNGNHLNT